MEKIPTTANGQAMYVLVPDGNGQNHKIVNFDNPEMVPVKGIKVVRSIKKSPRHQPANVIRCVTDPTTGIIYGMHVGVHQKSKELRFQAIEINDYRIFDLSVLQDRKEWAIISRAPFLVGSPMQRGKPTYILEDKEADAEAKEKRVGEKKVAYGIVENLSQLQVVDMARVCGGIETKNSSIPIIKGELYDFIDSKEKEKGAKRFNELWSATNREVMTVFVRCKEVGLVNFDVASGQWLWKNTTQLGTSEPMAIENISKNHSLLMGMDSESKAKDSKFGELASEKEKSGVQIEYKEDVKESPGSDLLKKLTEQSERLSEKEKLTDEKMEKLDKLLKAAESTPGVGVNSEIEEEKTEFRKLQEKAQGLGMKHAFLPTTDEAKIKQWLKDNNHEQ